MSYKGNIQRNSTDNLPELGWNVFSKCQSDRETYDFELFSRTYIKYFIS